MIYLSLANNYLKDISDLANAKMPKLNVLNLSNNEISDISCFEKMDIKYLKELYLEHNKISDITNISRNFEDLQILNLEENNIRNLNVLKTAKFSEKIKYLNIINDNKIKDESDYMDLNLCYFPCLEEISLSRNNKQLKILSIKMKLFGYEMNEAEEYDNKKEIKNIYNSIQYEEKIKLRNKISILIIPFEYSDILNIGGNILNFQNSFKIIANENIKIEEVKYYFLNDILELNEKNKKQIYFQKINYDTSIDEEYMSNYTVLYYIDINNIIIEKNKNTAFYWVNEYVKFQTIKERYNRIPNYLIEEEAIDINCKLKEINNIYFNKNDLFLIDNKFDFSQFLQKYDYYNKLPLIFISEKYFSKFQEFLEDNPKYKQFKNNEILNANLFISTKKNYSYKHTGKANFIAEVIENYNFYFYSKEKVFDIIYKLNKLTYYNYRNVINEWIMITLDILVEYILFILKENPHYYVCPFCKSPLIYIKETKRNDINEENYENDNNSKKEIPNKGDSDFNSGYFDLVKITNNFSNIMMGFFNTNIFLKYDEFIKLKIPEKEKKVYFPANPPKKKEQNEEKRYINIIYHDRKNYDMYNSNVCSDEIEFRKNTNGAFFFSNSIESFRTIIETLKIFNNENKKFCVISTGSDFQEILNIINNNQINFINKICIYCVKKENYIHFLNEYPNILEGVYTFNNEVLDFIKRNTTEQTEYEVIKLINWDNYETEYYKLHQMMSKYVSPSSEENFRIAKKAINEIFLESVLPQYRKNFIKGIDKFKKSENYNVLIEYTTDNICYNINEWMNNLNYLAFDKLGYIFGHLTYKLYEYGKKNKKFFYDKHLLFRGMKINYLDALSYKLQLNNIICFQSFYSTSIEKYVAEGFASRQYNERHKFEVLIEIDFNISNNSFPLSVDIKDISNSPHEKEVLFFPFSFFKLTNLEINVNDRKLKLYLSPIEKNDNFLLKLKNKGITEYDKINELLKIKNKSNNQNLIVENKNQAQFSENEINILNQQILSICKIKYKVENQIFKGCGFFVEIEKEEIPFKYALFTSYYILNENDIKINNKIEIEYYNSNYQLNKKIIKIVGNRFTLTNKELGFTCIELFESDCITNYLKIDNNIFNNNNLENKDIIILKYPQEKKIVYSLWKIKSINDKTIKYSSPSIEDFYGSPIIIKDNDYKIIGLNNSNESNLAISFNSILNYISKMNKITAVFDITDNNINEEIRIINSFEEFKNENNILDAKDDYLFENEKQIKENIKIKINQKYIDFTYYYKFNQKGKYIIEYFLNTDKLTRFDYLFYECYSLISLNLSKYNTQNITNMSYMLANCPSLSDIDVSNINTENVTNMSGLFSYCNSLKNLNIKEFNTKACTKMDKMFSRCSSLINLDLSRFDTKNVTDMSNMFTSCKSLESLDLSQFNTKNVTDMSGMFSNCISLINLDLSHFNTNNVIDMSYMFYNCKYLRINVSNFNTEKVNNMSYMFYNLKFLMKLDLSIFNTKNVINMDHMLSSCEFLSSLDLSGFDTKHVTNMSGLFSGCLRLKYINITKFNTNLLTDMSEMFSNCKNLIKIDISHFNTDNVNNMSNLFNGCSSLQKINLTNFNTKCVTDMRNMFSCCRSINSLDLSNLITENVTDMSGMFSSCESLTDFDLSNFITNNVTNMSNMFSHCKSLKNLDLSKFITQNVTDMSGMFYCCNSLENLNLSSFNTQKVTNMGHMFIGCLSLKNLDLSTFNTINVTDMSNMFYECYSLKKLDLSTFNTVNVTHMIKMFSYCRSLISLNLSNFNTKNVIDMNNIFYQCSSLKRVNLITKDEKLLYCFLNFK